MPDILGDPPRFTSARGTVETWYERDLSYRAYAQFNSMRMEAARRSGAHPDWIEHQIEGFPRPPWETPGDWIPTGLTAIADVRVLSPEWSLSRAFSLIDGAWVLAGIRAVTRERTSLRAAERPGGPLTIRVTRPSTLYPRDDLDAYCYGPHDREALALLQPRCFFHGREPIEAAPAETTFLGRPAELHRLRRMIPLDDPRILGDGYNPTVFEEAMETEVVVDRERGVVLEWWGLLDGAPFERHSFTAIAFDEPMDPGEFDRAVAPGDGRA